MNLDLLASKTNPLERRSSANDHDLVRRVDGESVWQQALEPRHATNALADLTSHDEFIARGYQLMHEDTFCKKPLSITQQNSIIAGFLLSVKNDIKSISPPAKALLKGKGTLLGRAKAWISAHAHLASTIEMKLLQTGKWIFTKCSNKSTELDKIKTETIRKVVAQHISDPELLNQVVSSWGKTLASQKSKWRSRFESGKYSSYNGKMKRSPFFDTFIFDFTANEKFFKTNDLSCSFDEYWNTVLLTVCENFLHDVCPLLTVSASENPQTIKTAAAKYVPRMRRVLANYETKMRTFLSSKHVKPVENKASGSFSFVTISPSTSRSPSPESNRYEPVTSPYSFSPEPADIDELEPEATVKPKPIPPWKQTQISKSSSQDFDIFSEWDDKMPNQLRRVREQKVDIDKEQNVDIQNVTDDSSADVQLPEVRKERKARDQKKKTPPSKETTVNEPVTEPRYPRRSKRKRINVGESRGKKFKKLRQNK